MNSATIMAIICGSLLVGCVVIFFIARFWYFGWSSESAFQKLHQERLAQYRRSRLEAAQQARTPFNASSEIEEALPVYQKEEVKPPQYGENVPVVKITVPEEAHCAKETVGSV